MIDLKPCPFCGGKAGLSCHDNHYVAECLNSKCDVSAYTEWHYPQSAEGATLAWNTRWERTCLMSESDFRGFSDEHKHMWTCHSCCAETSCLECINEDGDADFVMPKFCASCGAKVVER